MGPAVDLMANKSIQILGLIPFIGRSEQRFDVPRMETCDAANAVGRQLAGLDASSNRLGIH